MTTQLPPQGPPEPDEKLPGEAELAALYRQLPQSEPGPALDAAVLRAAAQALVADAPSAGSIRKTRPRWLLALSSAATLVLAAGLAWHMRELPPATSTPTAMNSAAPAQATTAASLPRATSPAAAMAPAEPASPSPMEPPKQPPSQMIVAPLRTPTANALRKTTADQSAERASSKVQVTEGLSQYAPASVAAPAVTLQETPSNSAVDKSPVAGTTPEMPATMAAAPAPAAPPADETTAPQVAGDSAANAAKPPLDQAAPAAPRVRARMPVAPTPFTAAPDMDTTSYASDAPAQELDKIRQLFALGRDDEARQRLTVYHLAHPRWDLPLDLQAKLRKP